MAENRYSDQELKEFDILIDEKIKQAEEQLAYYVSQLETIADNADTKIKALDDASIGAAEAEQASELALRQRKYIQHLHNAKLRIMNKVYGVCRVTGKLIPKERLRAVPHATLSIDAKQGKFKKR